MSPSIITALPPLPSLSAATSWELTVKPYLNALPSFANTALLALRSKAPINSLIALYVQTNPLVTGAAFAFALMPVFLFTSEFNRNYSQVDRVWSILPVIFNAHYAMWNRMSGVPDKDFGRVDVAVNIIVLWGARLTYNYWRRGGYQIGSEDYRWEIIQKNIGRVLFFLLNVTFISSVQVLLLFSTSFPTYVLLLTERVTGPSLTGIDYAFAGIMVTLIGLSATFDQQHQNYQNAKYAYRTSAKAQPGYTSAELDRGFCTKGAWAYSRHPNFACEQGVWVTLYVWSCAITQTPWNWSGIGALSYLALFQGSTWFTESISASKYPEYREYQRSVGMFIPLPGYGWSPVAASQELAAKKKGETKKSK